MEDRFCWRDEQIQNMASRVRRRRLLSLSRRRSGRGSLRRLLGGGRRGMRGER